MVLHGVTILLMICQHLIETKNNLWTTIFIFIKTQSTLIEPWRSDQTGSIFLDFSQLSTEKCVFCSFFFHVESPEREWSFSLINTCQHVFTFSFSFSVCEFIHNLTNVKRTYIKHKRSMSRCVLQNKDLRTFYLESRLKAWVEYKKRVPRLSSVRSTFHYPELINAVSWLKRNVVNVSLYIGTCSTTPSFHAL